jgi:acyl-CoA thioesterase II
MGAFENDTTVVARGEELRATLSRAWEIWGPNGGYVAAIALRAAGRVAPAGHRPASLSVQYLSVARFEDIAIKVDVLKEGRSAWCLNVSLLQDGKRFLQAQVWTTDRNDGPETHEIAMPDVPRPAALKTYAELDPVGAAQSRGFWNNFDSKPVRPYSPADPLPHSHAVREWIRFRDFAGGDDAFCDAARTVVLADTLLWPAYTRGLSERPDYTAPSLDVSVWFHQPPRGCDWLLVDAHSETAGGGLIHGVGRIWSEDGRLLATGASHMIVAKRR